MRTSDSSSVKSAGRALDILELVARSEGPHSFRSIAEALAIPASSLSQLLATLTERGYLEHVAQRGGYRAGPAIERLVARLWRFRSLAEQLEPLVRSLSDELGESVGLNLLKGDRTEVVAAAHAEQDLTYRIRVGATAPLYAVAAGKVFLAAFGASELEAYLARIRLEPLTPETIVSVERLRGELRAVRESGFAYSRGESVPGVVGVARAVRSGDRPLAALTVGLPALRHDDAADSRIRAALAGTAERAELLLARVGGQQVHR